MRQHRLAALFLLTVALLTGPVRAADSMEPPIVLQKALASPSPALESLPLSSIELNEFYAARQYRPAWGTTTKEERASLLKFLSSVKDFAAYHGLDLDEETAKKIQSLSEAEQAPAFPKLELLTTSYLLSLAHAMHGDRVKLSLLYPGWDFKRDDRDLATDLAKAVDDNKIEDFIAGLAPTAPAYTRLARELKIYRERAARGGWAPIPSGPTIKPGEQSPRVAALRARLAAEDYLPADEASSQTYDAPLRDVVQEYQRRNGLEIDGNVGGKTLIALNTPIETRIDQILANMERWRHMPTTFPSRYVVVNNAAALIEVWDDGQILYEAPLVVGRVDRKTPFIQSEIRSVIFNPSWHVPAKIAQKDILPKLRKDPHYLEKQGFVISGSANNPHGEAIDWNKIRASSFNLKLRQAPGDMNALGRLKFDFDNDFSVYMHGTPHQELFAKAERHQSSGCMRLRDPELFAQIVLAKNAGTWGSEEVRAEIDKDKTRWLKVAEPLPLYVVHWTVFAEKPDAPLSFRSDIYDYDRFLMATLRDPTHKYARKTLAPEP